MSRMEGATWLCWYSVNYQFVEIGRNVVSNESPYSTQIAKSVNCYKVVPCICCVIFQSSRTIMHCSNFGFFESVSCIEMQVKNMEMKMAENKGTRIKLKPNCGLFRIYFNVNFNLSFCQCLHFSWHKMFKIATHFRKWSLGFFDLQVLFHWSLVLWFLTG